MEDPCSSGVHPRDDYCCDFLGPHPRDDYYAILGLDITASQDEIRAAHYRLAKAYHPDKHPDKPDVAEHFKLIQRAADVLRDPELRWDYDMEECVFLLAAEDYAQMVGGMQVSGMQVSLTLSGLGLGSRCNREAAISPLDLIHCKGPPRLLTAG